MEAKAKQSNIRMPARKVRRIINTIRGKSVKEANKILKFMPYFAAKVVEKNLKCAVANAAEKLGALEEELVVSEIFADEGPTYKRARPRAQGRVYRIRKRNSHLSITLRVSEELKEKLKEEKKKTKKSKAKKQQTKPAETKETEINEVNETQKKEAKAKSTKKKAEVSEQEVVTEVKESEVVEEAKQEMEQGITPEVETQPEIESSIESEIKKAETGKNIKVEKEQRETKTKTEKNEEPADQEQQEQAEGSSEEQKENEEENK